MNAAVGRFNELREILGLPPFETRIGINAGVAFLVATGSDPDGVRPLEFTEHRQIPAQNDPTGVPEG
jgi:hypothetical protein